MGSKPRTSDIDTEVLARVGASGGAAEGPTLGRVITERMRPRLGVSRRSVRHARPGQLLRASQSFGLNLGLSHQNRRQYAVNTAAAGVDVDTTTVRPPIDYWPWTDATESADHGRAAARAAIVNRVVVPEPPKTKAESRVEALKRILLGPSQAEAAPSVDSVGSPAKSAAGVAADAPVLRVVRRGLPLTPRRHGRTWAGDKTSPGGMANGAAPQATNSVSPSRFGAAPPEPLPTVAHTGVSDGDRSVPATGVQRAPSRDAQLRQALQQHRAGPSDRSVAPTVSADRLAEMYSPSSAGRDTAPVQRPAGPGSALASSEGSGRSASVLGRTLAPEPAPTPAPSSATGTPARAADSPTSAGRVSAEILRTMSQRRPPASAPGDTSTHGTPGTQSAVETASPEPSGTSRPSMIGATSPLLPDAVAAPLAPSTSSPRPLTHALSGIARSGAVAHESTDLLIGASVQPPSHVNPDDGGTTVSAESISAAPARLPLATSARLAHRVSAPAAGRRDATATLTRQDRHRAEPFQRTLAATANRPVAGWGPRHRHGLNRSADGQSVQWTEGATADPMTVLGGVVLGGVVLESPSSLVLRTTAPAPLDDGGLVVAPPMHRTLEKDPAADTHGNEMRDRAAEARTSQPRGVTTRDRDDASRPAAPRRLSEEWVTSERLVDVDRLPAPARTAPPRALEAGLQRVLAGSNDMVAGLGELSVSPPAARETAMVGPVPVTAAVMAEALRTVTQMSDRMESADTVRLSRSRARAAEPVRSHAPGLEAARPPAHVQAPAVALSRFTHHDVPARPGAMFSKLSGVSLLGRRSPVDVTRPGPPDGPVAGAEATDRGVRVTSAPDKPAKPPKRAVPTAGAVVSRSADEPARMPAEDLAERFLTELTRHRQERPKPLPTQFASIADLIVGKRRPLVSTSDASQRALAAVDKVAATTGNVIHLASPQSLTRPTAEITGIIAHELTHVAAPSPAPRFFADDRHTAEERRATEIGDIMRRSPAPPPSGSIASSGRTPPMTITEQHTRSASTGTVTSTSSGSSPSRSRADTIHRTMASGSSESPTVQRTLTEAPALTSSGSSSSSSGSNDSQSSPPISSDQFSRLLREHFDLIVELLEDRIGSDIERRGGRYRGGY